MTCIAAVADGTTVWMGADSAAVSGWESLPRRDPKVFAVGQFLIGYTSSFRMGQLLRWNLDAPPIGEEIDGRVIELEEYMQTIFVDAVRSTLAAGGFATKEKEQEAGGTFMVGVRGRLFFVGDDYQVGELLTPYNAIGCGAHIALGALFALARHGPIPAERRVSIALQAAAEFSSGVRPPFTVWRLDATGARPVLVPEETRAAS